MEKRVLINDQSDSFCQENRPEESGTLSSNGTLEMRERVSQLFESTAADDSNVRTIEATNDLSSASTVSIPEWPANDVYIQPHQIRYGN